MSPVCIDAAYKSLNKYQEELCGDMVQILKTEDSDILILADGMGSGVKAGILATLTSKILGTMLKNGSDIEDCVETVARTLPVCSERGIAYATFSVLMIFRGGDAYLVEYDNPLCIFIRDGKVLRYPYQEREICNKKIREYRFKVRQNDCFILMSDGAIWAGKGELMNLDWTWEDMAGYALKCTKETLSASRLAVMLTEVCNDLYGRQPGDDTTVAVARVIPRRIVNIFTGPPSKKEDDGRMVREFMAADGKKAVCGGTSGNIVARELGRELIPTENQKDRSFPPTASIRGIDLVTEGVLTMAGALELLRRFEKADFDENFFEELDADSGAAGLARLLLEESTEVNLFVGRAVNQASRDTGMRESPLLRLNLTEQLGDCLKRLGKSVTYYFY